MTLKLHTNQILQDTRNTQNSNNKKSFSKIIDSFLELFRNLQCLSTVLTGY